MTVGLVIGKFYPPHRGHKLLIDAASEQADHVVVIVAAAPDQQPSGATRAAWLREIHPSVDVRLVEDVYDQDDSALWARLTLGWMHAWYGRAPDVVFTSEAYGDAYAAGMGCRHVCVDRARTAVPISGTAIRARPQRHLAFLEPCVRAHYVPRVTVIGAESTGTTTLAAALAAALGTTWVPEYGRHYAQAEGKLAPNATWSTADFVAIARRQAADIDTAARTAERVVIADTDALATALWHERYLGARAAAVDDVARQQRAPDLYLLTGDEIPFVQDGTRDGEHIRHAMHARFVAVLQAQAVPWHLMRGDPGARLAQALAHVRTLL